jgi:tRNA A37 threonylcarbamoyladenosine dehydratase
MVGGDIEAGQSALERGHGVGADQRDPDSPDMARRFGGLARLYGAAGLAAFERAHVCVVGVGGVGSWVVEALARSAVGALTLIDLDHVAESNINRQIQALESTLGQAKVVALEQRIAQINPNCRIRAIEELVESDNLDVLIGDQSYDLVIDAIDSVKAKTALIAFCHKRQIGLITIGAAGGQSDPTRVRVSDLAHTEHEPLLAKVRKRLRTDHGFPRNIKMKFGVDAVFSDEPLIYPVASDEEACATTSEMPRPRQAASGLNCAGFGSSVAVTAVFGLVAAGHALNRLARFSSSNQVP